VKRILLLLFLFSFTSSFAPAQCEGDLSWNYDEPESSGFSIGKFLTETFTPRLILDTRAIRDYVRDPRFKELTQRCGDLRAVDAIYLKALKIGEYDIPRALFLSLMGTLEHKDVGVEIPILGVLNVPLTFEEDSLFKARRANLPSRIYSDTPREGDKDKLQHFFASAYLAYATQSPEFAKESGDFVEWGEARFIAGGDDDPRDKRANAQGEAFGRDIAVVKTLLPSDYLHLPNGK
jgi:hypothetical protein